jgi:hypothetical protein
MCFITSRLYEVSSRQGCWVTITYRCVHCRSNITDPTLVRPLAKLKNQNKFTQTAYTGGENAEGVAKIDVSEMDAWDAL